MMMMMTKNPEDIPTGDLPKGISSVGKCCRGSAHRDDDEDEEDDDDYGDW